MNQCTLTELSKKQVINLCDGKILGHVGDLVLDLCDGKICAIVVLENCGFGFKKGREAVVSWCAIKKIGEDALLVDANDFVQESCSGKNGRKGIF